MNNDKDLTQEIITKSYEYLEFGLKKFLIPLEFAHDTLNNLEISFKLRGRYAGKVIYNTNYNNCEFVLKFNLELARENKDIFLDVTVPHEIAHIIVALKEMLGDWENPKSHGDEWKHVMKAFGIKNPKRCHNYETKPANNIKLFEYICPDCKRTYWYKARKHNRMKERFSRCGNTHFYCRCQRNKTRITSIRFTGNQTVKKA